jgi:dCTP deaminase
MTKDDQNLGPAVTPIQLRLPRQAGEGGQVGREGGLLSDLEILERLVGSDEDGIFVSPLIDPLVQLGPSSLDLHLGTELCTTRITDTTHLDLTEDKERLAEEVRKYVDKRRIAADEFFVLHPGEFALGATLEFIRLPRDIAGRLEGRSSLGRLGLQIHATAGFVDPGFEGILTFEFINAGRLPLKFGPGLRLGQICFFKMEEAQIGYLDKKVSKYGGRLGVEVSQLHRDPEILRRGGRRTPE